MLEFYNLPNLVQYYLISLAAIMGLVIGSFLNVVGLRLLSDENIVFPNSKCTSCDTSINWYDNIPVLSYLFLRGKCRKCSEKISVQYPIVEAITSISFVVCLLKFGLTLTTVFMIVLLSLFMVICITDIKEQLVYDVISYPVIPLGVMFNILGLNFLIEKSTALSMFGFPISQTVVESFMGIAFGFLFFEIISLIGKLILGERAFGEGDTVIAMGIGAFLGWKALVPVLVLSFVYQVVVGVPIMIFQSLKDKDYKTFSAYIGLIFALLIPVVSNQLGFSKDYNVALVILVLTMIIALVCGLYIISSAKQKNSYTFLPFGPALILGAITVIFFSDVVMNFIKF